MPSEKRRLLNCVLAASSWKNATLAAEFRQPFDMLIDAKAKVEEKVAIEAVSEDRKSSFSNSATVTNDGANWQSHTQKEDWLPTLDAFRTFVAECPAGMLPGFLSTVSGQIGARL